MRLNNYSVVLVHGNTALNYKQSENNSSGYKSINLGSKNVDLLTWFASLSCFTYNAAFPGPFQGI